MDENRNLNENNEVVENNDVATVKLDFNSIEATETGFTADGVFGEEPAAEDNYVATQPLEEVAPMPENVNSEPAVIPVQSVAQDQPAMPQYPEIPEQQAVPQQQVMPQQPMASQPVMQQQPVQQKKKKGKKKEKTAEQKAKTKKNLGIFARVAMIAVLSVVTIWTLMYTIDHTLAVQGITPVFSISETEYEGGNISCKCLGYKIQFVFDENGQLRQKCVWAWEKGPNDILMERGELFEKM